jgi:uncharacterized protein (TIGR02217 family)
MVDFIESPRFPEDISYGSSGGPGFKTEVFEGYGGIEQRGQIWSRARARYNAQHGIRNTEDMDLVRAFFYATRGRAVGFRYKDHADYELTSELIGTGDGVTLDFNIIKTYGTTNAYVRRIFKPVDGTISVTVGGAPVTFGTPAANRVSCDLTTGILTFGASVIPAAAAAIRVTCEFDVPVRFDTDAMDAVHDGWRSETWNQIPLIELLLDID